MKRSEILLKLQRFYSIKHIMVEQNYITPNEFMDQVLQLVEELGMSPPQYNQNEGSGEFGIPSYYVNEWELE